MCVWVCVCVLVCTCGREFMSMYTSVYNAHTLLSVCCFASGHPLSQSTTNHSCLSKTPGTMRKMFLRSESEFTIVISLTSSCSLQLIENLKIL